jgi:hypothetical protein
MKTFALVGLMVLTCWVASAADIDGRWTALTPRKNGGDVTEILVLKAAGNKLTGTSQRLEPAAQILEGVINGNEVSFKVVRSSGVKQEYKGSLSGGVLKLSMSGSRGGHRDLVFKKAGR